MSMIKMSTNLNANQQGTRYELPLPTHVFVTMIIVKCLACKDARVSCLGEFAMDECNGQKHIISSLIMRLIPSLPVRVYACVCVCVCVSDRV